MKIATGTIARLATPYGSGTIVTDAEPDAPPLPLSRFDCDVPFEDLRIGATDAEPERDALPRPTNPARDTSVRSRRLRPAVGPRPSSRSPLE
jgi:hypothetical protein